MGQVNQPATIVDQLDALRRETAELRKRIGPPRWTQVPFFPARRQDLPATVSQDFETLWETDFTVVQAQIELHTIDGCDADTVGRAQLVIAAPPGTVQLTVPWTVGPELTRTRRGPFALPDFAFGELVRVSVQYSRTSGTGKVYASVLALQRD